MTTLTATANPSLSDTFRDLWQTIFKPEPPPTLAEIEAQRQAWAKAELKKYPVFHMESRGGFLRLSAIGEQQLRELMKRRAILSEIAYPPFKPTFPPVRFHSTKVDKNGSPQPL